MNNLMIKRYLKSASLYFFLSLLISVYDPCPNFASPFRIFDLRFKGQLMSWHAQDLNNDGLKDLCLLLKTTALPERWLAFFIQKDNGFRQVADQTFRLEDEVVMFDFGDVTQDGLNEFVFFTAEGISYYSLTDFSYDLSQTSLLQTTSIFMLADKNSIQMWDFVRDINNDQRDEILVPQVTKFDIYSYDATKSKWKKNTIPLSAEAKVRNYYSKRFSVGSKPSASYATPYILFEDFDADNRNDLLGIYQDSLVVFRQRDDGSFSSRRFQRFLLNYGTIWHGRKIIRTHLDDKDERNFLLRVIDLNDDGLLDIVSMTISTKESIINPQTAVQIYFGRERALLSRRYFYFNSEPDQIIKPGGTHLVVDLLDFNHDNKIDIILPVVRAGLTRIIKMLLTKSVEIEAEFYLLNNENRYPSQPDAKAHMTAKFSFTGGATSPVYEIADFNGDGFFDILTSYAEKTMRIYWGNNKDLIKSRIGVAFDIPLPQDGNLVRTVDLNEDNRMDVIITYDAKDVEKKNVQNILKVLMKTN